MPQAEVFGIQRNILEQFSSFNTIFTLSALTSEQLNFPESANSYKSNQLGTIICRSGGGQPDNRIMTAYTSSENPEGKYEFYIDDVDIDSIISFDKRTNGSNATSVSFTVFEPYSMGMFLQAVQLAAAATSDKGMAATYTEAPFLLTIEFIGYDSDGNVVLDPLGYTSDSLNRHIPIMLSDIDLDVTASGSRYKITAVPYNEDALKDSVARLKQDVQIAGEKELTVHEYLQTGKHSLQQRLNYFLQERAKQGSESGKEAYVPDQVVILFPQDGSVISSDALGDESGGATSNPGGAGSATVENKLTLSKKIVSEGAGTTASSTSLLVQDSGSLNEIGKAKFNFDDTTGGESQSAGANEVQADPDKPIKRKSNFLDVKNKVFKFSQGTSIVNAITEVLLMSEYCKTSIEQEPDSKGMKKWFRIETQVYNLKPDAGNNARAKRPKLYVYKVVEYLVHEHRFKPPGAQPRGYEDLKKNCVKEYNYIYSGKNVDILNFDIRLKTAMFTTAYADMNAMSGQVYSQVNGAAKKDSGVPKNAEADSISQDAGVPTVPMGEKFNRYRNASDGPSDDYRSLVAKNFQESLLNSPADMLSIELEIMGDPYYIADSGIGNFSDTPMTFNLNKNGTMNYQTGEVDILINFRTPVDYNGATGEADFATGFDATGFSGLYNVQTVSNTFKRGKFTQLLNCIRRPVQEPVEESKNENKEAEAAKTKTTTNSVADDGGSATTNPSSKKPVKAVDTSATGDSTKQVEYQQNEDGPF
jgi:hypothetical protein